MLGRAKPWEPFCVSGSFWLIEQREMAKLEPSTKVGLNHPPNVLPVGFGFLGFAIRLCTW